MIAQPLSPLWPEVATRSPAEPFAASPRRPLAASQQQAGAGRKREDMTAQFARAPQMGGKTPVYNAPNAALLIDFDNVTMGIRSDLTKELRNLLNSEIIKG